MDRSEIERLRAIPIEQVAERLGLHVARHKSLCPFHDDHHASLTYNTRRNTFRCFVCDAHGGTIDLVMRHLGKTFTEACRWLADRHNVILAEWKATSPTPARQPPAFDASRYVRHFEHPWLSAEARHFLFTQRRLHPAVVGWCRLTSWTDRQGTHWLQIPYFATDGTLIGLQNRNLDYRKGDDTPRFRFPYGARCSIYNLPVIAMLRPSEPLYITEGASDCWAMLSAGHKAIAIPSATLLSQTDKAMLQALANERHTSFHMFPDRDAPGERLFMQLKGVLPYLHHHQLPPTCKDFAEYYLTTLPTAEGTSIRCLQQPNINHHASI